MTTELKDQQPKYFINVWLDDNGKEYASGNVHKNRADAVKDAEETFSFMEYYFTLTDLGRINLEPEFSDEFQSAKNAAYTSMLNSQMRASV